MARFLTLNVNGLRDPNKRMSFLQWLTRVSADFICLQETHVTSDSECSSWFSSLGFSTLCSPGSSHSCGTVLLFRHSYSLCRSFTDSAGRFVCGVFDFDGISFNVVSLYAPNRDPSRSDFFHFVSDQVDPSVPTIICGDFNAVFDRSLDRRGSDPSLCRNSSASLFAFFEECCIVDVWRYLNPTVPAFTWSKPDGTLSSRIDLIGCPFPWLHHISSCSILPCPYSDHSGVLCVCAIPAPLPRSPGPWKLNVSILEEPDFIELIEHFWQSWRLNKPSSNLQSWWDRGKSHIRGICVRYCSRRSMLRKTSSSLLDSLACHLKSRVDAGMVSLLDVYEKVLSKIADDDKAKARGARVRSRVRWAEEGEASTRFFLRLEKQCGAKGWIAAMRQPDGALATDIASICLSWVHFYSDLFSACTVDMPVQDTLVSSLSSCLSDEESNLCEGLFSLSEASEALDGMADSKAPGSDGLPKEFYKAFWHILGSDLVDVFNDALSSGCLSVSQRTALITLIFKKGDRLDHKNWRPISLLNSDYKLCARILAGRLLQVLQSIIGLDQTCGVRGRFIGDSVAFLRDLVDFTSEANTPAAILSLDQEKAFDRVDWAFLFRILGKFGFGASFISWVKLLYTNIRSAVLVNGYRSDYFWPSRGVRQGCPLSPLLYVISIEVLAANLRSHPDIIGLQLPGSSSFLPTVALYADDTSVIVNSESAIQATFSVYELFERGSGAKLNFSKCEGLLLGPWRFLSRFPSVNISWSSTKIKILGVFIGHGDLSEDNWRPRLDAVSRCLNSWRSRALSLAGRALVVNALALSRVWYVASVIHMPEWVRSELRRTVFNFIWAGKRELVARRVMYHPKSRGGFSVVSVDFKISALLIQWVRRLSVCPNGWVYLLKYWLLDRHGVSPSVFFANPSIFSFSRFPPFYIDLFSSWASAEGSSSSSGLSFGSSVGGPFPVSSASCKSTYQVLLSLHPAVPHCIPKFRSSFGALDWPSTWRSLFFLPLDRQVCDLNWKIAHGVLYTAERLSSFGLSVPLACFCGYYSESLEHLFFSCPLVQSGYAWVQTMLSQASPLAPSLNVRHALFGFSADDLRCVPRVFSYLLNVCKYLVWVQRNNFRFRSEPPSAVCLLASLKARIRFYLPLFFKRFKSIRRRRFFLRQWAGNGVFGHLSDSSFVCTV